MDTAAHQEQISYVLEKFAKLNTEAKKRGIRDNDIKRALLDPRPVQKRASDKPASSNGASNNGIRSEKIREIFRLKSAPSKLKTIFCKYLLHICLVIGVVSSALFYVYKNDIIEWSQLYSARCAIENNAIMMEISRPLVNCNSCAGIVEVPVEYNISREDFRRKYAYSGVPVLVKGATANWSAMTTFSFHFFQKLYNETEGALKAVENDCQFFPYKTEFETLADAFNISDSRANFTEGEKPWYIGW